MHLNVTDKSPEMDMGCQVGFGSLAPQRVMMYRTDGQLQPQLLETD